MDITDIIEGINRRVKRLEEDIGKVTDVLLQFASFKEKTTFTDMVTILQTDLNDSFLLGVEFTDAGISHCALGVTPLGERKTITTVYSGG